MTTVVEHRPGGDAAVRFAYDPTTVAAIKTAIPAAGRKWDKAARAWIVTAAYVPIAVELLRKIAPPVYETRPAPPPRSAAAAGDQWAVALHDALPEHLRRAAFRALARVLHPDTGGDTRLAQQLNDAFRPGGRAR